MLVFQQVPEKSVVEVLEAKLEITPISARHISFGSCLLISDRRVLRYRGCRYIVHGDFIKQTDGTWVPVDPHNVGLVSAQPGDKPRDCAESRRKDLIYFLGWAIEKWVTQHKDWLIVADMVFESAQKESFLRAAKRSPR